MSLTRTERTDLVTLARRRSRVAKDDAKARAAAMKAEVEEALAREFKAEDDRWKKEVEAARIEVEKVQKLVTEKLIQEGVPKAFHPSLMIGWSYRGENSLNERRVELRRVATTRIDEKLKTAIAEIERATVQVETDLLLATSTETARKYLMSLPSSDELLPNEATPVIVAELMAGKNGGA